MKAVIRNFDPQRQFGFAVSDEGENVMVCQAEVIDGTKLKSGLRVEFADIEEPRDGGRRRVAIGISGTGRKEPDGPQTGFVRKFDPARNLGFLKPKGTSRSIVFRCRDDLLNEEPLIGGQEVTYEIRERPGRQPIAVNVKRVKQDHQMQEETRSQE